MTVSAGMDEWASVIRYVHVQSDGEGTGVHKKEHITCPLCAPLETKSPPTHEDYEKATDRPTGVLITDGCETRCTNSECEYVAYDGVQIKQRVTDNRRRIGPFKDTSRKRYTHSQKVALVGGIGHL